MTLIIIPTKEESLVHGTHFKSTNAAAAGSVLDDEFALRPGPIALQFAISAATTLNHLQGGDTL